MPCILYQLTNIILKSFAIDTKKKRGLIFQELSWILVSSYFAKTHADQKELLDYYQNYYEKISMSY